MNTVTPKAPPVPTTGGTSSPRSNLQAGKRSKYVQVGQENGTAVAKGRDTGIGKTGRGAPWG